MTITPDAADVRDIVRRAFAEISGAPLEAYALAETILIRDGRYRGRSYRARDLMAMWFAELGMVQIYDADGNMLRTINLFEDLESSRRAA
jgi:hypothetical protein